MTIHDDQADARAGGFGSLAGFHEVLRRRRGDDTRIYRLRVVAGGAELWRVERSAGASPRWVKESDLKGPEDTAALLGEIQRALTAGGWR